MSRLQYNDVFLSLNSVFILTSSADPDKMPPYEYLEYHEEKMSIL